MPLFGSTERFHWDCRGEPNIVDIENAKHISQLVATRATCVCVCVWLRLFTLVSTQMANKSVWNPFFDNLPHDSHRLRIVVAWNSLFNKKIIVSIVMSFWFGAHCNYCLMAVVAVGTCFFYIVSAFKWPWMSSHRNVASRLDVSLETVIKMSQQCCVSCCVFNSHPIVLIAVRKCCRANNMPINIFTFFVCVCVCVSNLK